MNLPIKELLKEFENSNYHGEIISTSLDIQGKDISILLLCILFHNKLLTAKQLCTYFNKYDEEGKIFKYSSVFYKGYISLIKKFESSS